MERDTPDPVNGSVPPDGPSDLDSPGGPAGVPPDDALEDPEARRPSRKAAWLAMGAVALALAVIWLAPGLGDDGGLTDADYDRFDAATDADAAGKAAPLNFTLKDMHGVDVQLASFSGKVILLNFWATWCPPCKVEIPWLVELQEQFGDDLVVLGFSIDDTVDKLRPFAEEYKINYPLLVGNGREDVQDAFGPMYGIPVTVIIGRDARIAKRHTGIRSKEQLEREIRELL